MGRHRNMFGAGILLFLLLSAPSGGRAFMIHNTQHSLCLEDSADTGEVHLKECNLDSEYQQWIWINEGRLMCIATSRCLSAQQRAPVQTQNCHGPEVDAAGLTWDCDRGRLISRKRSTFLSHNGQHVILTQDSKHSKWRSLDEGDICQERLRFKRASRDSAQFEDEEEQTGELSALTDEQKEYLRWFYRTEDPTMWTFVLLGLAFICLLIGFLLLGIGAVANKSRKKIAQYKAAASLLQKDQELLRENSTHPASDMLLHENKPYMSNSDTSELKAGNIVVTWKDGNTSCLYADPAEEEKKEEEEKQEVAAPELESQDEVRMTVKNES